MSDTVTLREWSVCESSVPGVGSLHGKAYGHPKFPDGTEITTSIIVSSIDRLVQTKSRVYLLDGPPDPKYLEYLKEIGYTKLDLDHPVKIHNINWN